MRTTAVRSGVYNRFLRNAGLTFFLGLLFISCVELGYQWVVCEGLVAGVVIFRFLGMVW